MAKCEPGCTCGKHKSRKCPPGCTCKKHEKWSHTPETLARMGEKAKKRWEDPEYREKMTQAIREWKSDPEHRAKVSETTKRLWEDEEYRDSHIQGLRSATESELGYCFNEGYRILLRQHDHPLAGKDGKVYEHRKVLYDSIGPGPHECYWGCGKAVDWGGGHEGLVADHLDGDTLNNTPENLVPSCRMCNWNRGTDPQFFEEQRAANIEMEGGINDGTVQGLGRLDGHDGRGGAGLRRRKGSTPETHPHQ